MLHLKTECFMVCSTGVQAQIHSNKFFSQMKTAKSDDGLDISSNYCALYLDCFVYNERQNMRNASDTRLNKTKYKKMRHSFMHLLNFSVQ